jgi:hypothetical protein
MASTVGSGGSAASTRQAAPERYDEAATGYGWLIFAGTMLSVVGTLNIIYGIAAISKSKFYAPNVTYVISDLKTWGWVVLIIGAIQVLAALSIFAQTEWGRWVGVATASLNMIAAMLLLPGAPFLSLSLFAIDVLVIYGLIAYGGRQGRAA